MIKTHYPVSNQDQQQYLIVKDTNEQLTKNFQMYELFNPKAGLNEHPISEVVVACLQAIRDFYNEPIIVTSTYRNYIPVGGISPATVSPHMLGQAIDFSFSVDSGYADNIYTHFRDDVMHQGQLFNMLWQIGARGFGSYDNFIHIDTVKSELYEPFRNKRSKFYQGEIYAHWNKMKRLLYRKTSFVMMATESGELVSNLDVYDQDQGQYELFLTGLAGSVAGAFSEFWEVEDRGYDFDFWNVAYLVAALFILIMVLFIMYEIAINPKR